MSYMPIYEFQCQACGTEIEVLQKISDPHITDCDACGKAEMKKKVTAAAFRLSGAGWYETDFKKDSDNKKNLTENTTSKKDSASSKTSTTSDTSSTKKSDSNTSSTSNASTKTSSKNTKSDA